MGRATCKDCLAEGVTSHRPAPHSGPRCATHHRRVLKTRREAAHEARMADQYGLPRGAYQRLYEAQNGRCWICQWATGKTKHLALDHDHACTAGHPKDKGCERCWRGLLCGPCNQMIGRMGIEGLLRAYYYLLDPPASRLLRSVSLG